MSNKIYGKATKPLGGKAYGSIGHLPSSRLGSGDHAVPDGQAKICLENSRDRYDRIIVTEKLDGSNVAVAKINTKIVPLGRAGYPAISSPYQQFTYFHYWVMHWELLFNRLLREGESVHGEWLAQAHSTIYKLHHAPFVAFDMKMLGKRLPWDEIVARCISAQIVTPRVLSDGPAVSLDMIKQKLTESGHGVADGQLVEGAVWRVERRGKFDFMAKWVRPGKQDGMYLPEVNNSHEPVWIWGPEA